MDWKKTLIGILVIGSIAWLAYDAGIHNGKIAQCKEMGMIRAKVLDIDKVVGRCITIEEFKYYEDLEKETNEIGWKTNDGLQLNFDAK